jgi:hypothetical protein
MENWLMIAGLVLGGGFAGAWALRKGDKLEEIRKDALELSGLLSSNGWTILPEILRDLVVKDFSGALAGIRDGVKMLRDTTERQVHMDKIYTQQLRNVLASGDARRIAPFLDLLEDYSLKAAATKAREALIAETTTTVSVEPKE